MTRNRSQQRNELGVGKNTRGKWLKIIVASLFLIGLCVAIRFYRPAERATAEPMAPGRGRPADATTLSVRPSTSERSDAGAAEQTRSSIPAVVARVNFRRITRQDLARECLVHYGEDVLESLVNKQLIVQECRKQGINVSRDEVAGEIERMAKQFGIPVDQWLRMLEQERGITAEQYANDIIWPTLALRKLAGSRLTVEREELLKEFETLYGEAVRARLISVSNEEKAKLLRDKAAANPDDFGNLAKDFSEDTHSASVKGVIQPIRRHGTFPEIEQAVFAMADGEISPVIYAGGQYVILKREGMIPARPVNFKQVSPQLEEVIRDRKMRGIAQDVFRKLQETARIENVWNDPAKRERMPGVAAVVNGNQLPINELAEECVARHGRETLDGIISREILEQACEKRGIQISDADLDEEIARAALEGTPPKPDGSPDVEGWLKLVRENQGVTIDVYRRDAVWPTVALKKLVGDRLQITEEDIHKGFEANYGPRVRCLAIVLDNFRRAQQVFELARRDNTSENFAELAGQYSVEPGSQALRGEIPPIKKHGGQPKLEEEAFALRPGELSGIIQIGDKFIILRCEGFTTPIEVAYADVRDDIYRHIHEKKLRLAMADYFEKLMAAATIDNYLTGESRAPKQTDQAAPSNLPALRQVPSG